jgi:hypothetical protein
MEARDLARGSRGVRYPCTTEATHDVIGHIDGLFSVVYTTECPYAFRGRYGLGWVANILRKTENVLFCASEEDDALTVPSQAHTNSAPDERTIADAR